MLGSRPVWTKDCLSALSWFTHSRFLCKSMVSARRRSWNKRLFRHFFKRNAGKPIQVYVTGSEQLLSTPTTRCHFNREDVFSINHNGIDQKKQVNTRGKTCTQKVPFFCLMCLYVVGDVFLILNGYLPQTFCWHFNIMIDFKKCWIFAWSEMIETVKEGD